jgi:endo-1,4-beta-D-glucanase Y
MIALLAGTLLAASPCNATWPLWQRYAETFLAADGRVIDRTAGDRSTSEGQAYALFFSLVANDRALFQRVLHWTEQNLAEGDLRTTLPAWHWGKRRDKSWGIVDRNPASDADLWLAFDLLEAGRLWSEPRYTVLGERVLANVAARELAQVPGFGTVLLPGPAGFAFEGGFRVNPSYEPPQVLRRLAQLGAPWDAVQQSSLQMLHVFAQGGAAPDWALAKSGRLLEDPVRGRVSSYDAIRVPLWIGMMPERDPQLDHVASGLFKALEEKGKLPERLDARTLQGRGEAPPGFYAALLPLAPSGTREVLTSRLESFRKGGLYGSPAAYYDQNLILFAQGFLESRYRFGSDGSLAPAWESRCLGRAR